MKAHEFTTADPILAFIDRHSDKDLSSGNCGVFAIAVDQLFDVDSFVFAENDAEPDRLYHVAVIKNGKMYDGNGITNLNRLRQYAVDEDYPDEEPKVNTYPATQDLYRYILKGTEPSISVNDLLPNSLNETTGQFDISVLSPNKLNSDQIQQVHNLISAGGEIRPETLSAGISRAQLLAIATDNDKIVAVTAIKTPSESYRTGVFTKAGVPELLPKYKFESGFSYTDPSYRNTGITAELHRQLFQQTSSSLFATVRTENRVALLGLQRLGFKPVGKPFNSERGNYTITLLVK